MHCLLNKQSKSKRNNKKWTKRISTATKANKTGRNERTRFTTAAMAPKSACVLGSSRVLRWLLWCGVCACAVRGHRFWALADIHMQRDYVEGSDPRTYCTGGRGRAGRFGAYNCDTPRDTLLPESVAFMQQEAPDAAFVLWLGDSPTRYSLHPNHTQSDQDIWADIEHVAARLRDGFAARGVPVYPVLGNHDHNPETGCAPPEQDPAYYARLARVWGGVLGLPQDAAATTARGAYYSVRAAPGLRLVVLNSVLYYSANPHTANSSTLKDFGGQLAWLRSTLARAEAAGERVLVATHIPPVVDLAAPQWQPYYQEQLAQALAPHADLLLGVVCGHDHTDSFARLGTLSGQSTPFVAVHAVPALTPDLSVLPLPPGRTDADTKNPALRLYDYDAERGVLADYAQYYFDLAAANAAAPQRPDWRISYRAATEYGMHNLSAGELFAAAERIAQDRSAWCRYLRHFLVEKAFVVDSPVIRKDLVCTMLYTDPLRALKCALAFPYPEFDCNATQQPRSSSTTTTTTTP